MENNLIEFRSKQNRSKTKEKFIWELFFINIYDFLLLILNQVMNYLYKQFFIFKKRIYDLFQKAFRCCHCLYSLCLSVSYQSIFLTLMNEYTDWNRPVEHPVNLLDSTVDILGDALRVAPLIESGDLHSKWISSQTTSAQQLPAYGNAGPQSESRTAKQFFYVFAYQVIM